MSHLQGLLHRTGAVRYVRDSLNEAADAWHRFWFEPADALMLGIMRLLCGWMLFYNLLIWTLDRRPRPATPGSRASYSSVAICLLVLAVDWRHLSVADPLFVSADCGDVLRRLCDSHHLGAQLSHYDLLFAASSCCEFWIRSDPGYDVSVSGIVPLRRGDFGGQPDSKVVAPPKGSHTGCRTSQVRVGSNGKSSDPAAPVCNLFLVRLFKAEGYDMVDRRSHVECGRQSGIPDPRSHMDGMDTVAPVSDGACHYRVGSIFHCTGLEPSAAAFRACDGDNDARGDRGVPGDVDVRTHHDVCVPVVCRSRDLADSIRSDACSLHPPSLSSIDCR